MRLLSVIWSNLRDAVRWWNRIKDPACWMKLMWDILLVKIRARPPQKRRFIRLPNIGTVTYRRNKGDLWSLREIMLDECYQFPGQIYPTLLVDLGANIGLTSLWLSTKYPLSRIIAVEPDPSNLELASLNLAGNAAEVTWVAAAIGAADGYANFGFSDSSNLGSVRYDQPGQTRIVSIQTLMCETSIQGRISLLKVDIEGGESDLFSGDLGWLSNVDAIIAELHPDLVDVVPIRVAICAQGFTHISSDSVFPGNMEAFVNNALPPRPPAN